MCGKSSLKKLRTEGGWGSMPPASIEPLEQALSVLEEDLKSKKEEKKDMHRAFPLQVEGNYENTVCCDHLLIFIE